MQASFAREMRLYSGKIPTIADECVQALIARNMIEAEQPDEVKLDLEAVMKEYSRLERDVVNEAKNRMERHKLGYGHLGKMKSQVAKERGAPAQDEVISYLLDQMQNMLFHSNNVDEVFADDLDIRKVLKPILEKNMDVESELDREVRSKIKNLEEGTATFEIEYQRMMEQMKRKKGLES